MDIAELLCCWSFVVGWPRARAETHHPHISPPQSPPSLASPAAGGKGRTRERDFPEALNKKPTKKAHRSRATVETSVSSTQSRLFKLSIHL